MEDKRREEQKKILKELRGVHKTQKEFAEELGVSESTYIKFETGEREVSKEFLKKVKSVFPDFDINIFFGD